MHTMQRGSLNKTGIIKEMLEDVWRITFDFKDETPEPANVKDARKQAKVYDKIIGRWQDQTRKRLAKRKAAFQKEYYEIKSLFAFGKHDEAIKRLKKMKARKW